MELRSFLTVRRNTAVQFMMHPNVFILMELQAKSDMKTLQVEIILLSWQNIHLFMIISTAVRQFLFCPTMGKVVY